MNVSNCYLIKYLLQFLLLVSLQTCCWSLSDFQFLNPINTRLGSSDGGLIRRNATTYTQDNKKIHITALLEIV
jgi:hypothetical protein